MQRIVQLLAVAVPVMLFHSGCGDKCSRADDCVSGEVCYKGICQAGTLEALTCAIDSDCSTADPNPFRCEFGRCRLRQVITPTADSGTPPGDSGARDSGLDAMSADAVMSVDVGFADTGPRPDTGVPDLGLSMDATPAPDTGPADTGAADTGPADTGTTADAG
ncbi:MAG: hypothetical protein IT384_22755 [Deltaproteobacteria bacterium]|nr:hypothetical protein [Deltaproteobacteria bacterium]